jgi:hypothetical protein
MAGWISQPGWRPSLTATGIPSTLATISPRIGRVLIARGAATRRRRHQQYLRSQHPEQFQGSDRRGERGVTRLKGRGALSARPWMYSASCLRRKEILAGERFQLDLNMSRRKARGDTARVNDCHGLQKGRRAHCSRASHLSFTGHGQASTCWRLWLPVSSQRRRLP